MPALRYCSLNIKYSRRQLVFTDTVNEKRNIFIWVACITLPILLLALVVGIQISSNKSPQEAQKTDSSTEGDDNAFKMDLISNKMITEGDIGKISLQEKTQKSPTELQQRRKSNSVPTGEADEMHETVGKIMQEPLEQAHAWQIEAVSIKAIAEHFSKQVEPAFSPDSETVMLLEQSGDFAVVSLLDHKIVETWKPAVFPACLAWSKDGERLAYKSGGQLHIVDWHTKKDELIQLSEPFGADHGRTRLAWIGPDQVICIDSTYGAPIDPIYSLNLKTLKIDKSPLAKDEASRKKQFDAILASPQNHPYCELCDFDAFHPDKDIACNVYISEIDKSYSRLLMGTSKNSFIIRTAHMNICKLQT